VPLPAQDKIYFLHKTLHDRHAAEDILQDVWLTVLRDLPGVAEPGALVA
jgi:DNA-directed RNA polymerase specialized sigma24 family protein